MIKLIVGLGNPGPEYAKTRHNAGVWFVEQLAQQYDATLAPEKKFFGCTACIRVQQHDVRLLVPTIFMNNSGQAVSAIVKYFKIQSDEILVVHDDMDFPCGVVKLKVNGGDGGHKGLEDVSKALKSKHFYRLRIGIGHPGNRDKVLDYVLHAPSKVENAEIQTAVGRALEVLSMVIELEVEGAMQALHNHLH